MYCDPRQISVAPDAPLRQAVACMDRAGRGIVLVTAGDGRLVDVVVDGDLRRGLLAGHDFNSAVGDLLALKKTWWDQPPVTAPEDTPPARLLELMRASAVRQVPLLDAGGVVKDLATMADVMAGLGSGAGEAQAVPEQSGVCYVGDGPPIQAVIMAGGYGKRLHPLTADCPKPLLPVGEKPLLMHTIERLARAGIRRVSLSTHYRGEQIREALGDGGELGVELSYLVEERPLGTAGALGLMEAPQGPVLIINGDILTGMDFAAMLSFHQEHQATLTVAVRKYEMEVPFGVVETVGPKVSGITEKPGYSFFVNAGVYLLEPEAQAQVARGKKLDMTELIERLLDQGRRVVSFPLVEYWLDVGTPESYQRAQEDYSNGRLGK